jgi:hypothetical protein
MTRNGDSVRSCSSSGLVGHDEQFMTCDGQTGYVAVHYHRTTAPQSPHKSRWSLSAADECHTFCEAFQCGWSDERGVVWYITENASTVIGVDAERIAKFPPPVNQSDPWHGFPVRSSGNRPPLEVVRRWRSEQRIDKVRQNRILREQI